MGNETSSVRWQVLHSKVRRSNPRSPGEIRARPILCLQVGHIGRSTIEDELRISLHPAARICISEIAGLFGIRLSADPYVDNFHAYAGRAYFMQERYDHAVESMRRAVAMNPEFPLHHRFLAASPAQNGQDVDAHEAMKRYLSLSGTRIRAVAAYAALPPPSRHPIYLLYRKHLIEGVTKAGMPES
jgi:tetratricopeptide (TPR) repeat protein